MHDIILSNKTLQTNKLVYPFLYLVNAKMINIEYIHIHINNCIEYLIKRSLIDSVDKENDCIVCSLHEITQKTALQTLSKDDQTHILRKIGTNIYGENGEDIVWLALREDAEIEARNEPLLASFMHAAILSHNSLEHSLAFHLANQLQSSTMISTQVYLVYLK